MPNNIKVLLVGTGKMGREYLKVLKALHVEFDVVGSSAAGCNLFFKDTGCRAKPGGVDLIRSLDGSKYTMAINAVSIQNLLLVGEALLDINITRILLEKPGAVDARELKELSILVNKFAADVFLAYNRRFYASVLRAKELIELDGGVTSFHFEFTEWVDSILDNFDHKAVLENWFMSNSSHVVDLAFFLGGVPVKMQSISRGGFMWHSSGSNFVGCGETNKGALFTYKANWKSAGRWGVEVHTSKRKIILCPLEKLKMVELNTTLDQEIEIGDQIDIDFKPGLYRQVETFLSLKNDYDLLKFDDFYDLYSKIYLSIVNGSLET